MDNSKLEVSIYRISSMNDMKLYKDDQIKTAELIRSRPVYKEII